MRAKLAIAAIIGGVAASVLPITSASAVCWTIAGHCYNPCSTVGGLYNRADELSGGVVPNNTFNCLA